MDTSAFLRTISIPQIPEDRRYWFVRTDGGTHYSDFTLHGYIAISWDYITVDFLHNNSEDTVKRVIRSSEKSAPTKDEDSNDDSSSSELAQATTIYNKLKRFVDEMSIGDIVISPSKNSTSVSIGLITSDVYEDPLYALEYYSKDPESELIVCPYHKRRNVDWLKTITKDHLDIYLSKALSSQHSVSCLDEYAPLINRNVYDIYSIGHTSHATLRTKRITPVSFAELRDFFNVLDQNLASAANALGEEYDPSLLDVKLSINSPGLIEIAGSALFLSSAFSIIVFALNHYRHGGKSKTSFKLEILGQKIEFSNESQSKGALDYHLAEKRLSLDALDNLADLQDSLEMQFPEINSSSIEVEDSVDC